MKKGSRFESISYVTIFLVFTLMGCATSQISQIPQGAGLPEPSSLGLRVEFPAQKFSVLSPPADWEMTKLPGAVVAWQKMATGSSIEIYASQLIAGLPQFSYPALAEMFLTGAKIGLQDRFPGKATVTLAEQKEVSFEGKTFYQVIMNLEGSPAEGLQMKGKLLIYFLKTREFDYSLSLFSILGFYEKNRLILEQMVQSFTYPEYPETSPQRGL